MSKDTVIFYQDQIDICKRHLTSEQFGRLMFALFEVDNGEDPDVDDDIIMAFEFMALQKRIDRAKYERICERNRENGKKGGAPKGNNNAVKNNPKQPKTTQNKPNDNDNDNDNDNEDENDNDKSRTSPSVILKYLNFKTGADYNTNDEFNHQLINDLIESGYDYNDLMKVINNKCAEWLNDPVMRSYLRPSTLFGSKFPEYLAAPEPIKAETERKKSDELKDAKNQLSAKRKQLNQIRTDMEDPELVEESLVNVNSRFYDLRDQEAILEDTISRLEARVSALGG